VPQPVQLNFEVQPGGQEEGAVIPEFGPIAIVILVVSITAIVMITGRFKLFGFQKI
jgi:predicted secreted protein with PEFG-CTERM motif